MSAIELVWQLLPVLLGIALSPLAVMALIAILLSRTPGPNGVAYLLGWVLAIIVGIVGSWLLFGALELEQHRDPPLWIPVVRLVVAAALFSGAVWMHRRSRAAVAQMTRARSPQEVTEAAPQLPGWLRAVESFSVPRSFVLGSGIFLLNPVNMSCAIIASLDVRLAHLPADISLWVVAGFVVLGSLPMAVPVIAVLVAREKARPFLERTRGWIASHSGALNIALLVAVGFMQVSKAIQGFG